jgi:hypothetical protein
VYWRDPTQDRQWTLYQSGLSRRRADELASNVMYVYSPRWFDHNVPTVVVPTGSRP